MSGALVALARRSRVHFLFFFYQLFQVIIYANLSDRVRL